MKPESIREKRPQVSRLYHKRRETQGVRTLYLASLGQEKAANADVPRTWKHPPSLLPDLPAEMSEGFVGLGHAVRVFLFLHRAASATSRVHHLVGQALGHGLLAALA